MSDTNMSYAEDNYRTPSVAQDYTHADKITSAQYSTLESYYQIRAGKLHCRDATFITFNEDYAIVSSNSMGLL